MELGKKGTANKSGARYFVPRCQKGCASEQSANASSKRTAASVVSGLTNSTTQRSQKSLISITIQTELTWPQGTDTHVPVKTNSQTTQTHNNQNSAKNTEIQPLLLLHQEVTEVQMLQQPLPVRAVRGTLTPGRTLHLQKRMASQE